MPAKAFWKYLRIWNIAKILSIHLHIALLNLFYFPALGNSEVTPYRFFVSENATVGAEVGRLSENSNDKFVVLGDASAPFENFFDVNVLQTSGIIVTKRKLDHELFPSFDASIFNLSSNKVFKVEVLVTDVNDNAPQFLHSVLKINISEATQKGSKFSLGSAMDHDSGQFSVQGYKITSGDANQSFSINNRTVGEEIFADLVVEKDLDREEQPTFELIVEAFDGGQPIKSGTVLVKVCILDVNDNPPTFDLSRYTVVVPEDLIPGQDILTLNATDKDLGGNSKISYRIDRDKSDPDFYFMVNADNGRIYLNKTLDYEHAVQHKIVVDAVDGGSEPLVGSTVVIVDVQDVNDNKPTINIIFLDGGEAQVSEAAEPGDYIARVSVNDPDLGEISQVDLTLSGGNGRFGLQTESNIIYLVCVKSSLDRETQATYHITLNATDFGSPPQSAHISFTLTVKDVNDNPPKFNKRLYEFDLSEQAFPGTYLTQLEALDPDEGVNAEITYRLETTPQSTWFDINENSGLITTAQNLDYDISSQVHLVVVATDKGSPPMKSNTTVLVRISKVFDSAPVFDEPAVSITVPENIAVDDCFLQVSASDRDATGTEAASAVTYSFVRGSPANPAHPFALNATTGHLCVTTGLDRETHSKYELEIQATDQGGQWDRMRVSITVGDFNDHAPVFHPVEYVVSVDKSVADVGSPITQVSATDQDDPLGSGFGRVTYNIISGNAQGLFELNALTGKLIVAQHLGDVDTEKVHTLMVGAVDGGGLGAAENATLLISVLDGSVTGSPVFEEPQYQFNVSEDAVVSQTVGSVSASFPGGNVTYSLRRDPPSTSWFDVDPVSGDIRVSSQVDREILDSARFQILAAGGTPPVYGFASVVITIEDVNDNSPYFPRDNPTSVVVPFNLPHGASVVRIGALDTDEGLNGTVRYKTSSDTFLIAETTGDLRLNQTLPPQIAEHRLELEAFDLGHPSRSTSYTLVIRVIPPDPNCPMFATSSLTKRVDEDQPVSTIFATLVATTMNSSATVTYYVESSSAFHPFTVFPNGSIYLKNSVDREIRASYFIKVAAAGIPSVDQSFPCTSSVDVAITVDDVNDNPPIFSASSYTFHVQENNGKDAAVGTVRATDLDAGRNARLSYALSVPSSMFYVNGETGSIYSATSLDYETNRLFSFLVESSDGVHISQTTVHILVDDVNDNSPLYISEPGGQDRLAVVSTSAASGTWVADMRASDRDSGRNGDVAYSIAEQPSDHFVIDRASGSVVVRTELSQSDVGTHTVIIKAEDGGSPPRSTTTNLKIRVRGVNDNPSQFDASKFVFTPLEDAVPGDLLGSFSATSSSRRRRSAVSSSTISSSTYRITDGDQTDHFYLNSSTGDLSLLRKLNYESKSQFMLKIEKTSPDGQVTALTGQVNVRDTNDHTPKFVSGRQLLSVDENSPTGTEVHRFHAEDADAGLDGDVTYSLVSESPFHAFTIDSASGVLTVNAELDRENISQYTVVVNASDRSRVGAKFSTITAVVLLRDLNDNSPTFTGRDKIYVMEDEPLGYPVIWLSAYDPDLGANARIIFALESATSDATTDLNEDEEMAYFRLDSKTGVVTLAMQLDYERATTHILTVSATDRSAHNPRTTHQNITLQVIDVNDVSPHFERSVYVAEIPEEEDAGFAVVKVTALDEDSGDNGKLTYQLQTSSKSEPFTIDPVTGVISTTEKLDREVKSSFRLIVFAQDDTFPSLYDWCEVNVTIADVNDNAPKFEALDSTVDPPVLARLEISEAAPAFFSVYVLAAFDPDIGNNALIDYSIVDGDDAGDFVMNASSGELLTTRRLDRETTSSYSLKVAAVDNGSPIRKASSGVIEVNVLDWNDNDPQFAETYYTGNVTEELNEGQYVLTVRATDADDGLNGVLSYYLNGSSTEPLSGLFTINTVTGVITTARTLDAETARRHAFLVTAVDSAAYGPRKAQVTVTVDVLDVNDNSPVFEDNLVKANVSRSVRTGMLVARVSANDPDEGLNGEVAYSISSSSNAAKSFSVNPANGDITVSSSFPGNLTQRCSLSVIATDRGNPPRESRAVVDITIMGVTGGSTVQFVESSYHATISEQVQQNFVVTTVEAQFNGMPDEGIIYNFPSGNENGAFDIMPNGRILVIQPRWLDYEKAQSIRLIVSATKPGTELYGYAIVYIELEDENDNSPIFAQKKYATHVWEERAENLYVTAVKAFDKDSGANGDVRYYINSGNVDGAFKIDSVSGVLSTNRKLDRETHSKYRLILHAVDMSDSVRNTGTGTIEITVMDENDHQPTLDVPEDVSISEAVAVGTELTTVTANDLDLDPHVQLLFASDGNPGNFFHIDSPSGKITLKTPVDYEKTPNMTLRIIAYDSVHSVYEDLHVRVLDVNDNTPEFRQQSYHTLLDELSPRSTSVIQVQADDADSGENGRVSYRLLTVLPSNPLFDIDPETGWITVNKSEPLHPKSYVFNLEVEAFDHGNPPLSHSVSVRVQVRDVNDHAPIFNQKRYEGTIRENVQIGHSVLKVIATDADYSSENRNVFYRIVDGNVGGAFNVRTVRGPGDQYIGEVFVRSTLDRETNSAYTLTISAFDRGKPQQSSNTTVSVQILDVNDNRPRFQASRYYGRVEEDYDGNRTLRNVLSVHASDPDSTSDFRFKIISGNDDGAFEITDCKPPSRGCAQLVAKIVDYEAKSHYELTVQVSDARNSLFARSSTVPVIIDVEDVNEYTPRFTRFFIQKEFLEPTSPNVTLFVAEANDGDGGKFGEVTYSLSRSNWETFGGNTCLPPHEVFSIKPDTGEVYATRTLDYEECQEYHFQLFARDASGRQPAFMPVAVEVLPADEYPPHFLAEYVNGDPRYHFTVPYGSPAGSKIGQVNATDADQGVDQRVRYRLEETSSDGYAIDENTGAIFLTREVDSGNSRILIVTAHSTKLKATTHITVDITGAPPIAVEAQILSIVFGVIAGVACLVVIILCSKHCWNKRQLKKEADEPPVEEKPEQNGRMRPDGSPTQRPFHEIANHQQSALSCTHYNSTDVSFGKTPGDVNRDHQNRKYKLAANSVPFNKKQINGRKNKHFNMNNNSFDRQATIAREGSSTDLKRVLRHRLMKSHEAAHTGNDGSAEDEEVNRITSSSSSGRQSSSTSLLSDKKPRVADSGIQQDMDRSSFDAGGNTQPSITQSESVESVREFGSGDANVPSVSASLPGASNLPPQANGAGEEMAPVIDSLGPDLHVGSMPGALSSLTEGPRLHANEGPRLHANEGPAEQLQDWAPEFQPLSSVFSEIVRLKEESAAIREAAAQQNAASSANASGGRDSNASSVVFDPQTRPPPLLTSVPQHSGKIAAPVPITSSAGLRSNLDLGHLPLKGLLPRPNPHYPQMGQAAPPLRNHPSGVPPPYSYVVSTRPSSGKSRSSGTSSGKSRKVKTSSPRQAPSAHGSLPRTPSSSHESSFTSPGMSPSLSPALGPLAEDAPVNEPRASAANKFKRSRSDETNLTSNAQERMVHV